MTVPAGVVAPRHYDRKSARVKAKLELLAVCAAVYESAVLKPEGANEERRDLLVAAIGYARELRRP